MVIKDKNGCSIGSLVTEEDTYGGTGAMFRITLHQQLNVEMLGILAAKLCHLYAVHAPVTTAPVVPAPTPPTPPASA